VLVLTVIFLVIPLVAYAYFAEIRSTLHGKLCIALAATQIYIIMIMPLEEFEAYYGYAARTIQVFAFFFGAFSSNFCINLMCFDSFLTFKHFREPHYQSTYFKKFVIFLLGFFSIVFVVIAIINKTVYYHVEFFEMIMMSFGVTFMLTLVMNIFALISSFYYLIALSRSMSLSENTRFDVERER
jgi:hypothetical protein